jgi:hypothetical protein
MKAQAQSIEAHLQDVCREVRSALIDAAKDKRYMETLRTLTALNFILSGAEYIAADIVTYTVFEDSDFGKSLQDALASDREAPIDRTSP